MLRRSLGLCFTLAVSIGLSVAADPPKLTSAQKTKAKKALRQIQDFMGGWNLEGTQKKGIKTFAWKEKVEWSWKFKTEAPTLRVSFAEGKGKYYSKGEMTYDVAKKKYVLHLIAADKSEETFEGPLLRNGGLRLMRTDAKTGDVYRLGIETLADGVRMKFKMEKQDGGKGLFSTRFLMNGNKEGLSLAGGSKKPECIVTGGAASIAVSYQGKTYYVCCSGCRDAFNENPAKFLKK